MKRISVRELIEFVLKKGSINQKDAGSVHTALEGSRIHRLLQKELERTYGANYKSEVSFKFDVELAGEMVRIEGRADGLVSDKDVPMIDEIKTSEPAFTDLAEDKKELYWAQVKMYGYFYLIQNELNDIDLQVTYYQTTNEQITREVQRFTLKELSDFFQSVIQEYEKWLIFAQNWLNIRQQSIQNLSFPFNAFRAGQRELSIAVFQTVKEQKKLYAEAPTGTGKTISTLFPTIKLLGELSEQERFERIFYLTAKTITRTVAQESMKLLKESGLRMKSITITAKDKICMMDEVQCTPEHCPFANRYYERRNPALWELLDENDAITRETLVATAEKHTVCPFELSLDASLWCDVIIGDYNYLFDPRVALERFFAEEKTNSVFLIDEAHNLIERAKSMYTEKLSYNAIKDMEKIFENEKKIIKPLQNIAKVFQVFDEYITSLGKNFHAQEAFPDQLHHPLLSFVAHIREWLASHQEHPEIENVLQFYFQVFSFLRISEYYDHHFKITIKRTENDLLLTENCLDPSNILEKKLSKGKGSILFSASFTPLEYYKEMLGGQEWDYQYIVPSPFDKKRQKVIIDAHISTIYRNREKSIPEVAHTLKTFIESKKGNYFFFFPSYKYLDDVYLVFEKENPGIKIFVQENRMTEEEREKFLANFQENNMQTNVAFCVMGGIFSEGIDLKGKRLIGTAIVSVALPQMNEEVALLKDYYDETKGNGFLYAYQIPGMNKVIQAAGRVIRTEEDKGVVLLLDERFARKEEQKLLPAHWFPHEVVYSQEQLKSSLEVFWK